ncbi:MAG TPA: thioesterase family protein [Pseudobdellovibrionaceae bacterium]|jgi:acyl-CoA thioester hydrolase/1,4-dihydroxy-2-naphthoyl-CoA hydrolase
MSLNFKTQIRIKFREADPAQIMYFANLFSLAHDVFEEFILATGYQYQEWFSPLHHIIPLRHVEADYLAPLLPGQSYEVTAMVTNLGETSFKMAYKFAQNGKLHGTVSMVHVILDPKTKAKMILPDLMKRRLSPYLETAHGN